MATGLVARDPSTRFGGLRRVSRGLWIAIAIAIAIVLSIPTPVLAIPYDECGEFKLSLGNFTKLISPDDEPNIGFTASWSCTGGNCSVGFNRSGRRFFSFSLPVSETLRICTIRQKMPAQHLDPLPIECSGTYNVYSVIISSGADARIAALSASWYNNATFPMRRCSDERSPEVDGLIDHRYFLGPQLISVTTYPGSPFPKEQVLYDKRLRWGAPESDQAKPQK
jgi:hypothetical protein